MKDIELNRPFNINNRFKNGNLKDGTTFIVDEYIRIRIWFRDLEAWVNPPTDTNQSSRIWKAIEKHGVVYTDLSPNGNKYRTNFGKKVLSKLEPPLT